MGHPWRLGGFVRLVLGAWLFAARSALEGPPFFGAQSISGFAVWAKARGALVWPALRVALSLRGDL